MRMGKKTAKAFRAAMVIVSGALGFVLFRWTPATITGLAIYGALVVLVVVMIFILGHIVATEQGTGYWPKRPENH